MELLTIHNVITLVIGSVVFFLCYQFIRLPKNLPPGPLRLPFIGTIYKHGLTLKYNSLNDLSKEYGEIFCMSLFGETFVVLNSLKSMEEALLHRVDFAHRGIRNKHCWKSIIPNSLGFFSLDCDAAQMKIKSKCLSIFRNLGVGKGPMELRITQEINILLDMFCKEEGQAFNPCPPVTSSISNVILLILINERFDYDDNELKGLIKQVHDFFSVIMYSTAINKLPILRFIPPFSDHFKTFVNSFKGIVAFGSKYALPIVESYEPPRNSNFVESYLEQCYDEKKNKLDVDVEKLRYLLPDFLNGGLETTSTSIHWTLLYLANRPHIQQKLFEEINKAVGTDRPISVNDKDDLPYLQAVVCEVQRYANVIPVMVHRSDDSKEASLCGYTIPKNTLIVLNYYGVHMNKETWGDPDVFRPERFLDGNGKFVKHKHVIPFSVGKRSCVGEALAKQELFLFTAMLFQKFQFLPPEGQAEINEDPIVGGALKPKPFKIRAILR